MVSQLKIQVRSILLLSVASLALAACSSSVGGGSSPPREASLPAGERLVCTDGFPPPCH